MQLHEDQCVLKDVKPLPQFCSPKFSCVCNFMKIKICPKCPIRVAVVSFL
jgi:hypothetical protein